MSELFPRPLRTIIIAMVSLAFIAGAATGVALAGLLRTPEVNVRFGTAGNVMGAAMAATFDQLDLTPDQRRRLDSIVLRSAPRSRGILAEASRRLRSAADSLDADVRAVLTPAQRAKLDSVRGESRTIFVPRRRP